MTDGPSCYHAANLRTPQWSQHNDVLILFCLAWDKILGIPNRWFIAVVGSLFCVFIEYLLNSANALTWDYTWWNRGAPWLIFLFGYLTFFVVAFWVFDMKTMKSKLITVGTIWAVDVLALIVFIPILHWI